MATFTKELWDYFEPGGEESQAPQMDYGLPLLGQGNVH